MSLLEVMYLSYCTLTQFGIFDFAFYSGLSRYIFKTSCMNMKRSCPFSLANISSNFFALSAFRTGYSCHYTDSCGKMENVAERPYICRDHTKARHLIACHMTFYLLS